MSLEWMDDAACKGVDTETFFPGNGDVEASRHAKTYCASCPVIESCLQWALDNHMDGIAGNTTEYERRAIRKSPQLCTHDGCGRRFPSIKSLNQHTTKAHGPKHSRRIEMVRGMAAAGMSDPEIAREVGVVPETVMRMRNRYGIAPGIKPQGGRKVGAA